MSAVSSTVTLLFLCLLLSACGGDSGSSSAPMGPTPSYDLAYVADAGGHIEGETEQRIKRGQDASTVVAVPDEGRVFLQWSDGNSSATRQDLDVSADNTLTATFTLKKVDISYTAGFGGDISGELSQTIDWGTDGASVTAVANNGYKFVGWSDGLVDPERSEKALKNDTSITAEFERVSLAVQYTVTGLGSLSGQASQSVLYMDAASPVTAIADFGHHFVRWSDGLTTATRQDMDVTTDITQSALFEPNQYVIEYSSSTGGNVEGELIQSVAHGNDGTAVTAVPSKGHHFIDWSDGLDAAERQETGVLESMSVYAQFEPNSYSLEYSAGQNGRLEGETSQAVHYGESGSAVTAIPDEGYSFVEWSDGNSSATRLDESVSSNISVIALFDVSRYSVTYTASQGGTIAGESEQQVQHGDLSTSVTAVPLPDYTFLRWSDNEEDAQRNDGPVTTSLNFHAEFVLTSELPTYTLDYTAGAGGSIQGDNSQTVAQRGSGNEVIAVPDFGHHFVQWSDGIQTASRLDADVRDNISVQAVFAVNEYTVTYQVEEGGILTGSDEQIVSHGDDATGVQVTAQPDYIFDGWSDGNSSLNRTDTDIQSDLTVTALFHPKYVTVTFEVAPPHTYIIGEDKSFGDLNGFRNQVIPYGGDTDWVTARTVPSPYDMPLGFLQWSTGSKDSRFRLENVQKDTTVSAFYTNAGAHMVVYPQSELCPTQGNASQIVEDGGDASTVTAIPPPWVNFSQWDDGLTTRTRTDTGITDDQQINWDCNRDAGGGIVFLDAAFKALGLSVEAARDTLPLDGGGFILLSRLDDTSIMLSRHTASGELDPTFGADGVIYLSPSFGNDIERVDGNRFLIWGSNFITMYYLDGTRDLSFGNSGQVEIEHEYQARGISDLHVLQDGSIAVAFRFQTEYGSRIDAGLRLLRPDGTVDATFGSGGQVFSVDPDTIYQSPEFATIESDSQGRLTVLMKHPTSVDYITARRYLSDGSLDTEYGSSGETMIDGRPAIWSVASVESVQLSDGRLFVVAGDNDQFGALILDQQGSPAADFGTDGFLEIKMPHDPQNQYQFTVEDALLQAEDRIAIGSRFFTAQTGKSVEIQVVDGSGAYVESFGNLGHFWNQFYSETVLLNSLTLMPDGNILVSGHGEQGFLMMIRPDGTLEPSFGNF
jgi:uncharacterized delta-60 repeat protein